MAILDVFKKKYHPTTKAELKELVNNNKIKLSQIDVSNMTDFEEVFRDCKRTDFSGIENWNVSNVTNFRNCFRDCKGFNADISGWNTSNAKTMSCMFAGCENFDCDISKWDVSKIQGRYKASYIGNMFKGCEKFANHVHDIYTQAEAKGVAKEEIFNLMPFPRPKDHKVVILPQYQNDFNEIAERTEDLSTIDTSAVKNFNNFLKNSARKTFTGIEKMSMESARYCKNFLSGAKNFAQKFAITRKSKELRDAEKELKKVKKDLDKNTAKVFKLFKKYYKDLPEGKANKPTVRLYTSALMYFSNYEKTDEQIKKYKNILSGCPKDLLELLKNQRKLYDQYYDLDKKCNDLIDRDQNAIAQGKVVTEEEAKGKDLPKETVVEKAELPNVVNADNICKDTQAKFAVPELPNVQTMQNGYQNVAYSYSLSGLSDSPIKYSAGAFNNIDQSHLSNELQKFQKMNDLVIQNQQKHIKTLNSVVSEVDEINAKLDKLLQTGVKVEQQPQAQTQAQTQPKVEPKKVEVPPKTEVKRETITPKPTVTQTQTVQPKVEKPSYQFNLSEEDIPKDFSKSIHNEFSNYFTKETDNNYKLVFFEDMEQYTFVKNELNKQGIIEDLDDVQVLNDWSNHKHDMYAVLLPNNFYDKIANLEIPSQSLSNFAEKTEKFKLKEACIVAKPSELSTNNALKSEFCRGCDATYHASGFNLTKDLIKLQNSKSNCDEIKREIRNSQIKVLENLSKQPNFERLVDIVYDSCIAHSNTKEFEYGSQKLKEGLRSPENLYNLNLAPLSMQPFIINGKELEPNEADQAYTLATCLASIDYAQNKNLTSIHYNNQRGLINCCYDKNDSLLKSERFFDVIRNKNFEALMPKNEQTNQEKQTQEKTQKQEPIKHEEKRVSKSSMRR